MFIHLNKTSKQSIKLTFTITENIAPIYICTLNFITIYLLCNLSIIGIYVDTDTVILNHLLN